MIDSQTIMNSVVLLFPFPVFKTKNNIKTLIYAKKETVCKENNKKIRLM